MMNKRIIIAMCCSISLICGAFPFNAVADDPVNPENVDISEVPTEAANYFVWFENVEQSALMEEASVKANEYEDTLDRTEYTSNEIEKLKTDYYKKLLRELTSAAITERAENIMAELGIDKNKAAVSKYVPMIVCELTPEQFAAAENCELVTSVSPYEALEEREDATEGQSTVMDSAENYWLWYENIDDTPIINEAAEKANDYLKELENSDYSSQKIEQMYADYFRQLIREMTKAAYSERAESIMAELGIDNNKAAVSQYAPLIICELTPEQVAAAENCQYVTSVSLYEPISDAHDATDSQPMTCLPYELRGDANNDIKVNLNDAVAILQYIALPEKYPLNSQGMLNADCDGVPGISGGDALWVQKYDAGLI